jgi:DNA-binding CsgD family transcriptional regulator
VSHDHAEIEFGRAGLTIRDCGSRNGTFINGERVHEHPFLPGDTVWIAYVSLDVLIGDAHAPHVDDPEETPIPERTNRRAAADDRLTAAQQPIFRRLIQGLSEAQIADAMCLSYHTVHSHVKNIYKGYGVNSRRELMAGLLDQAAERQGAV